MYRGAINILTAGGFLFAFHHGTKAVFKGFAQLPADTWIRI
jgi:hypothetical protein